LEEKKDMSTLRQLRSFWIPWVAAIVLFCFSDAVAQKSYIVTDLGNLPNNNLGCAMDVNNQGWTLEMSGVLDPVSNFSGAKVLSGRAVINIEGFKIDLGTLGGPNSWMNWGGINDRGQAVGMAETAVPDPDGEDFCAFGTHLTCRPFLWQDGHMSALPTVGGNNGTASDINNRGQIAGAAETTVPDSGCPASAPMHTLTPVIWQEGIPHPLPTVGGDPDGVAFAINARGQAVGESGICAGALHAISWENGTAFPLPDVGGGALAQGVNDIGQIVGTIGSTDGTTEFGALWQNGVLTNLGTLPGDFAAIATGINNQGQVVGSTLDSGFNWAHGFVWQNGVMTDLNTLFPASSNLFVTMANKINQRGQISGMATVLSGPDAGDIHAFLATPVDVSVGTSIADVAPAHPNSLLSGQNSQGLWLMFGGPFRQ
jgi:probable HAF family extracellular repeat protein